MSARSIKRWATNVQIQKANLTNFGLSQSTAWTTDDWRVPKEKHNAHRPEFYPFGRSHGNGMIATHGEYNVMAHILKRKDMFMENILYNTNKARL
jgi:hypothetical protein